MSDVAETKPDPTTQAPEADKPTTGEGEKTVTEVAADKATEVAETAKDAAVKTSDTVFSMFGGGPKKEEKPKADEEENDRSGSAKAQKEEKEEDVEADKVSWYTWMGYYEFERFGDARCCNQNTGTSPERGVFSRAPQLVWLAATQPPTPFHPV
jgi:hypothetical protein